MMVKERKDAMERKLQYISKREKFSGVVMIW